jgi:stringent starvation protein B
MDAGSTPQILVNTKISGVSVPMEYVKDGVIVLNIHERAVQGLVMDNDAISFSARFGGVSRNIYVPVDAIAGIYGRENGQGLYFDVAESAMATEENDRASDSEPNDPEPPRGKPNLRLV